MMRPLAFILAGFLLTQGLSFIAYRYDGRPAPFNVYELVFP